MLNPRPHIRPVAITPHHNAWVIDDALLEPDAWVQRAATHFDAFEEQPHNAYPGPELRMPDGVTAALDAWLADHLHARMGLAGTVRGHSRLSIATRAPHDLQPRQWLCHRDRLTDAPGQRVLATVLYLFRDPALGGTAFFAPRRDGHDTAVLVHESGTLPPEAFTAKYGLAPGYMTASNPWFEKLASIAPRYNRLVAYDGGALWHCSDIAAPDRLAADPKRGRLTLNGFFVCTPTL